MREKSFPWDRVCHHFIKSKLFFLLLLLLPTGKVSGQVYPADYAQKLSQEINSTDEDSLKISKLFDLAFFYNDYLGDDDLADSVSSVAIQLAEMTHQPDLLFFTYNRYIETNNLFSNNKEALKYALKAEQSTIVKTPVKEFRNATNLVAVYLAGYKYDKALEYSYKALSIATASENKAWKAESYLNIGECLEGKNQKIEAFRNYLNAVSLADRIKNKDLQIRSYQKLSHFYNLNRLYNKATQYKLLQQDLIKKLMPVDSVALVWTWYDLQEIDLNSNNNHLSEKSMQKILDFAKRWNNYRLLKFELALIRTHLIEAENIRMLYDLYYKQFPLELERLASENPGLYTRLKAYFCELENRTDSALYYFNKAELILQTHPNKILQSNFYNRFGQFLLRHEMKDKAIEKFQKSYEKAGEASYFDYMLGSSRQLESLYAGKGDFKNAYHYAALNKVLSDSLNNLSKNDQLLIMEIDHETRQREINAELEKQSDDRRHYLQYMAIIISIISLFVILLMLGSLKVPEWIIRMLGFFSFIFLFEFIILIADHNIHDITHGEPWKILLIKIFLIAILLPVHHWIEKRVVAFLLNPRLVNIARYPLRTKLKEHITRSKTPRPKSSQ